MYFIPLHQCPADVMSVCKYHNMIYVLMIADIGLQYYASNSHLFFCATIILGKIFLLDIYHFLISAISAPLQFGQFLFIFLARFLFFLFS